MSMIKSLFYGKFYCVDFFDKYDRFVQNKKEELWKKNM